MASSYQIPWAYRAATEPTSVSHDRETGPANDLIRTAGVRPGPPGAQEHSHGDGPLLKVVCVWYRSHNIIRHGPHTCRRTTRTALDEAIIPVVICQQSTIATKWLTRTLPLKIDLLTLKSWRWFSVPQGTALGGACPWSLLENQYETHKNIDVETCRLRPVTSQCTKWWFPTAACVWTSLVQWNVWIHRLPRANVSTLSPALVGRHFSSVFILLSFMLCQCNVMTLLNNLSGTGTWPCKRHHGHCMIPPLPLPLPSSTGVDSRLQLLACGLYLRLMARTSFGPAQPQHCPHYCWQGMHGLPKCGSALVTMLLLVCLAGPSTSGRPASSTPWGWESARAPPRAVSFQQYLPSFAWIRGISQIPDVAELRQVFLFIYFMLSLDTWHLSDTPMQLSSIDVHMLWYVLQFLVSPGAVYLPQGSSLHLHWLAPLHAAHQPFCYQAPSHCKGQPFAAYGLSWCSAHALTAWVSVKWLSPLNTPATGLPGYSAHPCAQHRSIPKPQPYSPRVFQAVQWSNPLPPLTFFFQSTTIGPLGPARTSYLGSVWTPTSAIMRHSQPWPQRVSHPHATVCIACSTRSPARNAWHDTRSLRLPRVCCPQPGTPPAAHVCNACATRGWACNVCSTRSICPHIGTRTLRLPRVWYPQPLPALCIDTCSLRLHRVLSCGTWLQRVQHPQTLACPVWTPAHGSRCLSFTQPWWSCSHWETACSALACKSAKSNGWVPPSAMAATCVSPANPCLPCVEHPQPWACTVCSTRSNCSQLAPARYVCLVCDTPVYNTCSPSLHSVTLCSSWLQRVQHLQTPACIVWTPAHGATSRLLLSLWTCDAYPGQGCLQDGHLDTDCLWCICILTGQLNGLCHQLGHSRHWTLSIAGLNQLLTYSTFGLALSPSYVRLFGE